MLNYQRVSDLFIASQCFPIWIVLFYSQEKSRNLRPNSGSGCYHRLNQKEDRHTPRVHVLKAQYKWPFTYLYNLLIFFTSTSSMSAFLYFFRTFFLCLLWSVPVVPAPTCHDSWPKITWGWRANSLPWCQSCRQHILSCSVPRLRGGLRWESTVVDGEGIDMRKTRDITEKKTLVYKGNSPRMALLKAVELLLFTHL